MIEISSFGILRMHNGVYGGVHFYDSRWSYFIVNLDGLERHGGLLWDLDEHFEVDSNGRLVIEPGCDLI
jgi:hypothetical protein